jgi:two-component system, chemotaxis family, protein-glutamate methylesterase/glutaminase
LRRTLLEGCESGNRTFVIEKCSVEVSNPNTIVVIGASAGGVNALRKLVLNFSEYWPVSVFITIHTGKNRNHLPRLLSWESGLPVSFARHGEPLAKGIYFAPPDRHLIVGKDETFLSAGPRENLARPAIDPMFRAQPV